MGILDEMLGGLLGAGGEAPVSGRSQTAGGGMSSVLMALLPVVLGMLANRGGGIPQAGAGLGDMGGLGDLLDRFRSTGYGDQANSWVSTGQNLPISPDTIGQVFGPGGLGDIAHRAGVTEQQASEGLSQLVPEVVDHLTPGGQVPDFDQLNSSVDSLLRRMGI